MTRDNTNSQVLILRVYPTIKHTVTKSSYFLGLSIGLSLFTMGDGLLSFSGVVMLTHHPLHSHWDKSTHWWTYSLIHETELSA